MNFENKVKWITGYVLPYVLIITNKTKEPVMDVELLDAGARYSMNHQDVPESINIDYGISGITYKQFIEYVFTATKKKVCGMMIMSGGEEGYGQIQQFMTVNEKDTFGNFKMKRMMPTLIDKSDKSFIICDFSLDKFTSLKIDCIAPDTIVRVFLFGQRPSVMRRFRDWLIKKLQ